ncbi:MAG: glycosyltransferase family 2 protein [Prevotella sp.]|nr:glycosyltransferase family 2 protein [Prevotella sp.]
MWYKKYQSIYGKPFSDVPVDIIRETRERLARLQSEQPLASIVVIAYNEETRLQACLWSISEMVCQFPVEVIGVDNDSTDRTTEVYENSGIPFYKEHMHSCGYARRCGLQHARGRYYIDVDADTIYPPHYFELMIEHLQQKGVACVSATWGYLPDRNHSKLELCLYEKARDLFLWIQHFKRPELSVRGLVFAYNAEYARKESYRVDIIRGEDGSMALALKKYGKIKFIYNKRCKAMTGYGSMGSGTLWHSFVRKARFQFKGISRLFYVTKGYKDTEDNLVKDV